MSTGFMPTSLRALLRLLQRLRGLVWFEREELEEDKREVKDAPVYECRGV